MGGNCWWASHSFAFSNISIECKMEIQTDNLCKLMPLTLCVLFVSIVVKQKATAHTHTCTLKHRQRHIWLKALRIRRMGPSNVWHVFFCFAFLAFCFVFFFFLIWTLIWLCFSLLSFVLWKCLLCSLLAALLALPVNDGQKQRPNNELAPQYNNKYNKQSVHTHTAHAYVRLCVCVYICKISHGQNWKCVLSLSPLLVMKRICRRRCPANGQTLYAQTDRQTEGQRDRQTEEQIWQIAWLSRRASRHTAHNMPNINIINILFFFWLSNQRAGNRQSDASKRKIRKKNEK